MHTCRQRSYFIHTADTETIVNGVLLLITGCNHSCVCGLCIAAMLESALKPGCEHSHNHSMQTHCSSHLIILVSQAVPN